jgi:hypothetical protein
VPWSTLRPARRTTSRSGRSQLARAAFAGAGPGNRAREAMVSQPARFHRLVRTGGRSNPFGAVISRAFQAARPFGKPAGAAQKWDSAN